MTSTTLPDAERAQSDLAETAAWHWLAYESGLSLRRAKAIILDQLQTRKRPLHDTLSEAPSSWQTALGLTVEEAQMLENQRAQLESVTKTLVGWNQQGLGLVRWDEPGYPPTLRAHMRPEEQPLLLGYRGELGLLEMPAVLALAGSPPDEDAGVWTLETMLELAGEGALPLAVGRAGLDAELVRALLSAEAPLALALPRGLASYSPPPALAAAISSGRALLLSPFRPDWTPPSSEPNPVLAPTLGFAQALANALLIITPPHPQNLLPEQPCFLRPGIPKTVGCQSYYSDPETLFLRLVETPVAAAIANAPSFAPPSPTTPPTPSLDPEKLIDQLSALGNVPEAMKARLRNQAND
ncbi:MAG TPA: hypothetical protein G4N94_04770 [Caldilineae bacterium]|nr:hypothetical protein [Caldilineae bacterium]